MTTENLFAYEREQIFWLHLDWSQDAILSATRLAETGDYTQVAELCDCLLADDRVSGVMSRITRTILGIPCVVTDSDEGFKSELLVQDCDSLVSMDQAQPIIAWGLMLGIGIGQLKPWKESSSGRLVPRLEWWHPRDVRYIHDQDKFQVITRNGVVDVDEGSGDWIVFTPYGRKRPWASGAWRGIAPWWLAKYYALDDWKRRNELHGSGAMVLTVPEGTKDTKKRALARSVNGRGRGAAIVLEAGTTAELLEGDGGGHQTFMDQIEKSNTAFAVALAGVNLTTEVQGGSYAAAKEHGGIERTILAAYSQAWDDCVDKFVTRPWSRINLGFAGAGGKICRPVKGGGGEKDMAEVLQLRAGALAQLGTVGEYVDVKRLVQDAGVPVTDRPYKPASHAPVATQGGEAAVSMPVQDGASDVAVVKAANDVETEAEAVAETAESVDNLDTSARKALGGSDGDPAKVGQAYVDMASFMASQGAALAMKPTTAKVLAMVRKAKSFEELQDSLGKILPDDIQALAEVTRKALVLGALAGRWAVQEEATREED